MKFRRVSLFICFLVISEAGFAQVELIEQYRPSKEVCKQAKSNVKEYLLKAKDSLKLKRIQNEMWKFKLDSTNELEELIFSLSQSNEIIINNSIAFYEYQFMPNKNKSSYQINFVFDKNGAILNVDIVYILVAS